MTPTEPMIAGRKEATDRRRQRVLAALAAAVRAGKEPSVSAVARTAGVDRTFLYRHRDLLHQIHAAARTPHPGERDSGVTRASLQADLAAALERNTRLTQRTRQLEKRLSEALGEQVWSASGLGAPPDIDHLQRRIRALEQELIGLREKLTEKDDELQAARAANRELMGALNRGR